MQTKDRATERNHYKVNKEAAEPPVAPSTPPTVFHFPCFFFFYLSSVLVFSDQNATAKHKREKKKKIIWFQIPSVILLVSGKTFLINTRQILSLDVFFRKKALKVYQTDFFPSEMTR